MDVLAVAMWSLAAGFLFLLCVVFPVALRVRDRRKAKQ